MFKLINHQLDSIIVNSFIQSVTLISNYILYIKNTILTNMVV